MSFTGVFGATFDPCHNGHIAALKAFVKAFPFERVFVVPTGIPPHKQQGVTSSEDRLKMLEMAVKGIEKVEICDYEIRTEGKSYTVNTLKHLKQLYPNDQFVLFTGSDMFLSLDRWYKAEEIMKNAVIAVLTRTGTDAEALKLQAEKLRFSYDADCRIIDFEPINISSSQIRERIADGGDASEYLLPEIYDYIKQKGLYKKLLYSKDKLKEIIKDRLDGKRYEHSLAVAKAAVALAERYGADREKAEIAGLLHDVNKCLSAEEQLSYAEENKLPLTETEKSIPPILHAITGAHFAETALGVRDEEIVSAIRWHTTGRAGMTLLDKIIFTADVIEETRNFSDVDYYRKLAFEDLDRAVFEIARWTIITKSEKNQPFHTDTVGMYNEYLNSKGE